MDMQMPVMDGIQATAAIRLWEREQQHKPTPIVALTANAFKEEADKSLAAGCTAHLTKPIRKHTLLETICLYTDTEEPATPHPAAYAPVTEHSSPNGSSSGETYTVSIDSELKSVLPMFLAGRKQDMVDIRRALARHDFHAIGGIAHAMKGASNMYRFDCIAALAETIEQAAKTGSAPSIESDLALRSTYLERGQIVFA